MQRWVRFWQRPLMPLISHLVNGRESRAFRPGGGRIEAGLPERVDQLTALDLELSERASPRVTTPLGESANDELLSKTGSDPFCGSDCEIPKDKTNSAIGFRKIKIRKAGCRQITA